MRGRGDVLMGKNTMMKRAIRDMINDKPELERLVPLIKQNVGFVLTNGDLTEIRDLVMTFTVPAAARSGAIAPVPVTVPPQNKDTTQSYGLLGELDSGYHHILSDNHSVVS